MSEDPFKQARNRKLSKLPEEQAETVDERSFREVIRDEMGMKPREEVKYGQILKDELGLGQKDKASIGEVFKEEFGLKKESSDRVRVIKEELGLGEREKADRAAMLRKELGLRPKKAKKEVPINPDQERIEKTGMSAKTKMKVIAIPLAILFVILLIKFVF